ncbi:MAG TPA: fluoride efflux transporter CrcB [Steroidobacteraceae bacterium]|nr:fluoride efflux transporter CrcB [Steroidobacteraceae bacterium]
MNLILCVAGGGAVGSVLRYLLASSINRATGMQFPLGTAIVNVIGCFLIGLLYVWLIEGAGRPELRALLMIGVLGGFTTFSSFSLETVTLTMQGNYLGAALNVCVSVLGCLAGTVLGISLARHT